MILKNKKGVVGTALVSFPALVITVAIILVYLIFSLTGSFFSKKGTNPTFEDLSLNVAGENFLLKEINLEGKNLLVIEKIYSELKNEKDFDNLKKDFKIFVQNGECLLLYSSGDFVDAIFLSGDIADGLISERTQELKKSYELKEVLNRQIFYIDGNKVYLEYYYGGCI